MKDIKWRSILALMLILTIIYFNWTWGWAILFLLWIIPDFFSGVTFLMEPIKKEAHPILYWTVLSVWAALSVLLLLDEFAPKQLPKGWSTLDAMAYQSYNNGDYHIDYNTHSSQNDTLFYKDYLSGEFNVVGISTETTLKNNQIDYDLEELWKLFLNEDISTVIPDIIDDKIYVVQSDFDKNRAGYFRLTIGYKTASLDDIYKGLTGVKIKASKYAVVETSEQPLEKLRTVWEKIALSDLPVSNQNNIEVFHYNTKSETIEKVDIWLSVPMSEEDSNRIKAIEKTTKIKEVEEMNPLSIPTKKTEKPYKLQTPKMDVVDIKSVPNKEKYPTHQHKMLTIVGIQKTVNHQSDEEIAQSIQELWELFFQKDYSKHIYNIVDYERVYLTYTNYTNNEVTLTLGYATGKEQKFNKKKQLNYVSIAPNQYYRFRLENNSSNYRGEEWSVLDEVIEYRSTQSSDFEVYTFDKNYKIINSFLWIGAK